MDTHALFAGLVLSLLGSLLALIALREFGQDTFAIGPRLVLSTIAAAATLLAVLSDPSALLHIGLGAFSLDKFAMGIVVGLVLFVLFPVIWFIQKNLVSCAEMNPCLRESSRYSL
ncbi:MAG TPA: hypothetical protein VNI53_06585 [Gammaproteobacteria bacterium]|nr:hypothetical protein [Gammaproteobacteria bacterium]